MEQHARSVVACEVRGTPVAAAPARHRDNDELARLIARVMRQDQTALAGLYESLSGRVYAVALHITRQVSSAEEVLQDTFSDAGGMFYFHGALPGASEPT